jgi:hypothetical protein
MREPNRKRARSKAFLPGSECFEDFVVAAYEKAGPVQKRAVITWILSTYKREALIRIGAQALASQAAARERRGCAGSRRSKATQAAISFVDSGSIDPDSAERCITKAVGLILGRLAVGCRRQRSSRVSYDIVRECYVPAGVPVESESLKETDVDSAVLKAIRCGRKSVRQLADECKVGLHYATCSVSRLASLGLISKNRDGRGPVIWRAV